MPNFNKSKGFQLRSGNKANAPFKMMGSSPANYLGLVGKVGSSNKDASGDLLFNKQKTPTAPEVKTIDTTKAQANTNKPGSKNYTGTDKNTDESHLSTKTTDKKGEVKTKAFKNDVSEPSKPKPELSEAEKAAKKTDRAQEFRDAGAIIASIPQGKSMVETQQKIADRKTSLTDKSNARKDKDIQNAKDIANTERTNQVIAENTANLNKDSNKLPADTPSTDPTGESSAEKIANQKAVKAGVLVENADGSYSPSSSADHQFISQDLAKKSPAPLMGLLKKKVNKELETPAGKLAVKAATGGAL